MVPMNQIANSLALRSINRLLSRDDGRASVDVDRFNPNKDIPPEWDPSKFESHLRSVGVSASEISTAKSVMIVIATLHYNNKTIASRISSHVA